MPELSRSRAAASLYNALEKAVQVRSHADMVIHCDLSGGMDSTPLCYLATRTPSRVVATTAFIDDPGGMEDLYWARRALPSMSDIHHVVVSLADAPPFYSGMPEMTELLDMPTQAHIAAPRIGHSIRLAMDHHAGMYINGLGGDHVLCGVPAWNHTLFRKRPILAWRRLQSECALNGGRLTTAIRQLVDGRPYRQWLVDTVRNARSGDAPGREPLSLEWGRPIMLPRWLTSDAAATVINRLKQLCVVAEPLGDSRAAHTELGIVRDGAAIVRGVQQFAATTRMPFESPFLDDRVIEACFAARREERYSPTAFKPLIKEAMRYSLPAQFLQRSTKVGGETQAARGLRSYWDEIVDTCESSPLGTLGIIDIDVFRQARSHCHSLAVSPAIQQAINTAIFSRNQHRRAADPAAYL